VVEGEDVLDAQPLHDDEARGIGIRVVFVAVVPDELDGSALVLWRNPFNDGRAVFELVEKADGEGIAQAV